MRYLAFRFDVDSVTCVERIPALRRVADALGVRFTFMVNMGRSWSWRYRKGDRRHEGGSLRATEKLGWRGVVKTLAMNPCLGIRYERVFKELQDEGHELGLHGAMNHARWQYGLNSIPYRRLAPSFCTAWDEFRRRFGAPMGFAAPGFRTNAHVDRLLAAHDIRYASDRHGEVPFRFRGHWEVPPNVMGEGRVPIIEQGLAAGYGVEEAFALQLHARDWAVAYDHPCVAGVHSGLLKAILRRAQQTHRIVPLCQYLDRWEALTEAACLAS